MQILVWKRQMQMELQSKDSSMESENYHKDANLSVKAPNADGTPVWPIP